MQFNGVNNKEHLHSPGLLTPMRMCRNSTWSWIVAYVQEAFSGVFCSGSSSPRHLPSLLLSLPPSFHCFNGVTSVCSSYCMVAHDWVARICQPWEQSSSRSWLPIVEAPGCLRHPTSMLVKRCSCQK